MNWLFFYQSGAVLAAIMSVLTLFAMDLNERERGELAVIFLFGLVMWPAMLYGLIVLNLKMWEDRVA